MTQKELNRSRVSNIHSEDRQLIVLAVPSVDDEYYRPQYDDILAFQASFAQNILGKDNVIVLGDSISLNTLAKKLPQDILLERPMEDIWMRDFSPITLNNPIIFKYSAAGQGGNAKISKKVQKCFTSFITEYGLEYKYSSQILDGGNVIWNDNHYYGVLTERFLRDNNIDKCIAKNILKEQFGFKEVAILPERENSDLGHIDGMAMFIDNNTLVINRYTDPLRRLIFQELQESFGNDVNILETDLLPVKDKAFDKSFSSVYGSYVNALVTNNYLYLPVFGESADNHVIQQIQHNTEKQVVPIFSTQICFMGGNVRCLSWQLAGKNAYILIDAARSILLP